ncbi:MAG TPA: ABC transporter permease [Bryobacteraceae bacterium]|nr:ABC transporter permease [Bryobacteraceae bacterium]
MAIPLAYNLRNLAVRKTTTVMTALGIALTVAVLLAIMALVEGLQTSLGATGNPLHVLVMRKGSTSELTSNFNRSTFQDLIFKPGIARSKNGEPMASLEMVTVISLESPDNPDGINITLRGLAPIGIEMRDEIRLSAGRWFQPGRREVVVGRSIANRYSAAQIGNRIRFGRGDWEIVGVFDAGRSAANSEIFADLNQVASDYNRSEVLSSALVRAVDPVAVQALVNDLQSDRRFNVMAQTERSYYEQQMQSAAPIEFMGMFVAVIMAIGSSFAAMNTMYAAVARRSAEIGTLRVLGFSKAGILSSFLIESLLLSLVGGLLGCLLVLPLNSIETGIGSFVTFSEIAFNFRVTGELMLKGLLFALLMGAIGGVFPARMAANKEILTALREI